MLPSKGVRLCLPAERKEAGRTAVKMCFDRLLVQTDSGRMVRARIDITAADQESVFRLKALAGPVIRNTENVHWFARLPVLRQGTCRTAIAALISVGDGYRSGMLMHCALAGRADVALTFMHVSPADITESAEDNESGEHKNDMTGLHRGASANMILLLAIRCTGPKASTVGVLRA